MRTVWLVTPLRWAVTLNSLMYPSTLSLCWTRDCRVTRALPLRSMVRRVVLRVVTKSGKVPNLLLLMASVVNVVAHPRAGLFLIKDRAKVIFFWLVS